VHAHDSVQGKVGVAGDGAVVAELRVQVDGDRASISVVCAAAATSTGRGLAHLDHRRLVGLHGRWQAKIAHLGFRSMQVVLERADARASAASERAKPRAEGHCRLLYTLGEQPGKVEGHVESDERSAGRR